MTSYVNPTTRVGGVEQVVVAERPPSIEVDEAPFDDAQYVRVNGEWVEVDTPEIVPDTLAPKPPTALVANGNIASGGNSVNYTLSWTAPTQNTDDTPLTDLAYYVVRWRYGTGGAWASFVSNEASALLPGLRMGVDLEWSVLARDYSGNDSSWAEGTADGVVDTQGPERPSPPTLTSRLGTITATWNGLDHAGAAQPADFARLEVFVGPSNAGPWTYVDRLSGAGAAYITNVEVGDLHYVSSVAVDTSGNTSPRSAAVSILVDGVQSVDIDTTVFDSIDADITTAMGQAVTEADGNTKEYVQSRATDLVTNGTGFLKNNTNFSSFTFDPADAPEGAAGSFLVDTTEINQVKWTDELVPVDTGKGYLFSYQARQKLVGGAGCIYGALLPHDGAGQIINVWNYSYLATTTTTLAQPLNPGQTTVTLTSAANWRTANASVRYLLAWNWTDSFGKVWPVGSYSRNVTAYASIAGNVLTLSAPYAGPALPAGHPVSNSNTGGSFMYIGAVNALVPQVWTRWSGLLQPGVHDGSTGAAATSKVPAGTAAVKVGFLANYSTTAGTSKIAFAMVSLSDASAASYAANNITETQITNEAITTPKIKANNVVATHIATEAILARHVKAGEIVAGKLGAGAVEAGNVAANAIQAGNIEAGAVTTNELDAGAVTTVKLAANAVEADKIAATAIDGMTITGPKIRTAATGQRTEIGLDPGQSNTIDFYSGRSEEVYKGGVYADASQSGSVILRGTDMGAGAADLLVGSHIWGPGDVETAIDAAADVMNFAAPDRIDLASGGSFVTLQDPAGAPADAGIRLDSDRDIDIFSTGTVDITGGVTGSPAGQGWVRVDSDGLRVMDGGIDVSSMAPVAGSRISFSVAAAATNLERTDAGLVFVAPRSGRVAVNLGGFVRSNSGNGQAFLSYRIRTGSTIGAGTMVSNQPAGSTFGNYSVDFVAGGIRVIEQGLTPGATYNVSMTYTCAATGIITSGVGLSVEPCM